MWRLAEFIKIPQINKILTIFQRKSNIFLFLFIGPLLIVGLFSHSESNIYSEENQTRIENLAWVNNNTLLPLVSPNNPEPKVVKKIKVIATAYSSTPWETYDDPFITAAGTRVRNGIIANNYLPFGTRVRIPELFGDKIFVVEDRLNSKKGYYQIDIWFPSHQQAKEFGAKTTYIEVLEN